MLSKRNFAMMMIMNLVVLVLFLFSVVLKEYFNDYDVNHAAETKVIEKKSLKNYLEFKIELLICNAMLF